MSATDETLDAQLLEEDLEQSPDLSQLVGQAVRAASEDMRVSSPGIAAAVDLATGTCSARAAVTKSGATQEPLVPDVPLLQLKTSLARLHLPVGAGDPVTMLYADRSIDEWSAGSGEQVTAADPRSHDATDAMAIPFAPAPAPTGRANDAALQCGDGEVAITSAGKVELNPKAGQIASLAGETDRVLKGDAFKTALDIWLDALALAVPGIAGINATFKAGVLAALSAKVKVG